MQLYDYQQDLYAKTVQAFTAGYRKPLIVCPCGSGKSYIFAKMVEETAKKGEVLILIHRIELKEQHTKLFRDLKISMDNVRIEMVFTEANNLGKHPKPRMIVLDEAQFSKANSWVKIVQYYDTYCVGFTATPCRLDGKSLGDIYDVMIEGVSAEWLISHNKLSPYEYYAPTLVDVSNLKKRCGDYSVEDLEPVMMDKAIYGDIIENYCKLASGKKSIAFCVSVNHSKEIARIFNEAGIKAAHLDGTTPKQERKNIMDSFRNGDIKILCNCSIIAEGISVDDCECCLLLRPTDSLALYIQSSMRCMRYLKGKTAIILDFVGNYTRHGLPTDEHEWSLTASVEKRRESNDDGSFTIRQCPACYKTFKTASVCPYCRYVYEVKGRELKQMQEIELKRIMEVEKKSARMEVGRCRTRADLEAIAKERGYDRRWVFVQCKIKKIAY